MKVQDLKQYPLTVGSVLTLMSFIGAFLTFDARYALASDVRELKQETTKELKNFRVQQLEDKIFELDLKIQSKGATPVDKAMHERYKNQRETLIKEQK